MRLLSFRPKRGGAPRIGVLLANGRVLDVGEAARRARQRLPFDAGEMLSLIACGRAGLAALRKLMRAYSGKGLASGALRLLAPIPRPRKNVFCVGWNYLEHFEEGARARPHVQDMPAHPAFFTKAPTAVNGPFDPIPLHAGVTEKLDWEVELGVVIGRGGRDIEKPTRSGTSTATPSSTTSRRARCSASTGSSGSRARAWTAPVPWAPGS